MSDTRTLIPAKELAERSSIRFPNETRSTAARGRRSSPRRSSSAATSSGSRHSAGHCRRAARSARDYAFVGEEGPVRFADLFGPHDTLVVYKYMYGPERKRPCPMCTSLMSAWDGEARDVDQRVVLRHGRPLADRAPRRVQGGARLAESCGSIRT